MSTPEMPAYSTRSLGAVPLNVHQLRSTKAGRETLRELGRAAKEPMSHYSSWQRKDESKNRTAPFVGWDGEGMDIDGSHRYTLLANSIGSHIHNPAGLTTYEALDFLTTAETLRDTGSALNVVFSGGYDVNMILSDLSYGQIRVLCRDGQVRWRNFRIKYRPGRYFKVYRLAEPYYREAKGQRKGGWNVTAKFVMYDVWGFFQHSFVAALEEWRVGDAAVIAAIKKEKGNRGTFIPSRNPEILAYCLSECRELSRLSEELRRNFLRIGYIPKTWTGPGAVGAAVFDKHKIKKYQDRELAAGVGPVAEASLHAYFGGRIEAVQYGRHVGKVYAHDIVSAYPAAMRELPCLAHGEWKRGWSRGSFTLAKVELDHLPGPIHPLPHRLEDGRVVFPPMTKGWYWCPELYAFTERFPGFLYESDCWGWSQSCTHRPFAFIDGLYEARAKMKREGNASQLAIKLVLNSLYGKTCQRLGGAHGAPPYHQLEWAGYITSKVRAQVYALAMGNPGAVVSFETDGVYATEPLCQPGDGSLGSWEVTEYDEIVYVTSGVYWLRKGGTWIAKYRGMDPGSLSVEDVLIGWENDAESVSASSTRFRGMFTSTVSPERFMSWGQWRSTPRDVKLYPTGKRIVISDDNPALGLQPTMAAQPASLDSHPHRLPWRNGTFPLQLESDQESREDIEAYD